SDSLVQQIERISGQPERSDDTSEHGILRKPVPIAYGQQDEGEAQQKGYRANQRKYGCADMDFRQLNANSEQWTEFVGARVNLEHGKRECYSNSRNTYL